MNESDRKIIEEVIEKLIKEMRAKHDEEIKRYIARLYPTKYYICA